ncbi:RNA polymerase sigma-70 factor (ECF subfamily) [Algoriphagus sp. 4150]|uniref:RNA polymerase sigma factor n=1 Tax=Algoriphagus sp. 4150 TaxID=2817756 RepID=UPI00285735BD|nr:sigma-70 family RNA polymerase sigma factor [Algoriphagus sp. 4150]MDR7131799.1 RNA polymerase sigma-70 factor (ECF subfamily) [Algoriphagus sp. 4150]
MQINKTTVRQLKEGNQATYKAVYMQYYAKLMGIGRKFSFRLLSPEDFVHETFLKLYEKRALLNEEVLLDKQLFVICRNIILNHVKREKKNSSFDPSDFLYILHEEEESEDIAHLAEKRQVLNTLLDRLPQKQKEIFTLHKIDGYSYDEIEEMTNLSQKTIANHIYLASKSLKENLRSTATLEILITLMFNWL